MKNAIKHLKLSLCCKYSERILITKIFKTALPEVEALGSWVISLCYAHEYSVL